MASLNAEKITNLLIRIHEIWEKTKKNFDSAKEIKEPLAMYFEGLSGNLDESVPEVLRFFHEYSYKVGKFTNLFYGKNGYYDQDYYIQTYTDASVGKTSAALKKLGDLKDDLQETTDGCEAAIDLATQTAGFSDISAIQEVATGGEVSSVDVLAPVLVARDIIVRCKGAIEVINKDIVPQVDAAIDTINQMPQG